MALEGVFLDNCPFDKILRLPLPRRCGTFASVIQMEAFLASQEVKKAQPVLTTLPCPHCIKSNSDFLFRSSNGIPLTRGRWTAVKLSHCLQTVSAPVVILLDATSSPFLSASLSGEPCLIAPDHVPTIVRYPGVCRCHAQRRVG